MSKCIEIKWRALANCPQGQLNRVGKDKYELYASKRVFVIPHNLQEYVWETVERRDVLKQEAPDFFNPSTKHGSVFLEWKGLRIRDNYLLTFNSEDRGEVIKGLNRLGCIEFSEVEEGFLIDKKALSKKNLMSVSGVLSISEENIIQRRKRKSILIPTGISIDSEDIDYLSVYLSENMSDLSVSTRNSRLVIKDNEVCIPIYSLDNYSIINPGEKVAEVIANFSSDEVILTKETEIKETLPNLKVA